MMENKTNVSTFLRTKLIISLFLSLSLACSYSIHFVVVVFSFINMNKNDLAAKQKLLPLRIVSRKNIQTSYYYAAASFISLIFDVRR